MKGLANCDWNRVDGANADVIKAVDFIGTDGYPFWEGKTIPESSDAFWQSVRQVQNAANNIKVRPNQFEASTTSYAQELTKLQI